jgi:hypothetical protein
MKVQEIKVAMSESIVNAENSSMYSMGTDKLLDLFTFEYDNDDNGEEDKRQQKARQLRQKVLREAGGVGMLPEEGTETAKDFLDAFS